ncbi:fibronectin type III domain-containing protein [Brucella pseudogrignonensis]|nr:fibronectin type III domain-containing protein [Brucella pseudogrignonensis]MDT6941953.1 fibronectin type III domain-containing protein [Brucella pseudogrignonensis]
MPVAISGLIAAIAGTGVIGAALQTGLAAITMFAGTTLGGLALSLGFSYLASSLFRPSQPKPEDVQQQVRQATPVRVRHYGRVKTSGAWIFAEAKQGIFHKVLAVNQGEIDAVEEYWIDDHQVVVDADGWVRTGPWGDWWDLRIQVRLGLPTETNYQSLTSTFTEWTSDHRGDGIASLYAMQDAVNDDDYLSYFPNGVNTNYRLVIRASKVKNPSTGVVAWDDNAASIIRDFMTHSDGMRLPESLFTTPLAQAGWVAAYNRAGQAIELAAGGTEPRYRLWGSYQLNERPADVLGRMLACCDGRLVPTPDGGLTLDIGEWAEPTVILTADAITGFSDVGRGRDVMTTANTIRATFLDPTQDYQSTDADPWADEDAVSERGEEAKDVQFNMAPSHSQARRLMKLEWFRANPNWVGTFNTNLMGLAAFGERFIRIHYSLFGIDSVFEVLDFKFIIGEGGILQGATIQVQSMPSTAYQWDSSQEGEAPVSSETDVDDGIPVPAAPVIAIKAGPSAELTFSPSSSVLLNYMVRWRKTSDTEWTVYGPLANEAQSLTIPNLAAATQYEFQMALRTEKGRLGSYGPSAVETTPAVDS